MPLGHLKSGRVFGKGASRDGREHMESGRGEGIRRFVELNNQDLHKISVYTTSRQFYVDRKTIKL
jgi:hypothetical protein